MTKIDYTPIIEEISNIMLDPCELQYKHEESIDEDGFHLSSEFWLTDKQKEQVKEKLRLFCIEIMNDLVNAIWATEDAKKIHYE